MAKLARRKGRFAGERDKATGLLLKDVFPATKAFHKPQREHVKQPMPERTRIVDAPNMKVTIEESA